MRNDFTFILIIFGLFAAMFGLVWVCDKIIGSDEEARREAGAGGEPDPLTADGAEQELAA